MRIEKFRIPGRSTNTEGIDEINIERLGAVVALVGRNGSGKSRILRLLEKYLIKEINALKILQGDITKLPIELDSNFRSITDKEGLELYLKFRELSNLSKQLPENQQIKIDLKRASNNYNKHTVQNKTFANMHSNLEASLESRVQDVVSKYVRRIHYSDIQTLQQAMDTDNSDDLPILFERLVENVSEKDNYNEFMSIHRTALTYLAKLPHQLVYDYDECYGNQELFQTKQSYTRYNSLKKLVQNFLNKELTWEKKKSNQTLSTEGITTKSKGIWKLNNREFIYSDLSDGEKTLFSFTLLFFLFDQNPQIRIKESIIIIDEPELHLHPESELAIIGGIRSLIENKGQLWIATHSISILSDLSYDEIFMVKGNRIISPSSITPGQSFIELMGLDNHIEKLSYFVSNISNWAFINFMTQCFNKPDIISGARENDPEIELFKKSLKSNPSASILLDFGAGQGRIYKEILADSSNFSKLHYYALEPDLENHEELKKISLKGLYGSHNELPANKFDHILLCGVLHEIPIIYWQDILNTLINSLTENGYIVLIEDMRLPKGEKVQEEGFLILDIQSVKELFSLKDFPAQILSKEEHYRERILCCLINKKNIGEVTQSSIINSLETLASNVFKKIKNIRKEEITQKNKYKLGRESAFYSQLYINAILANEKLKLGLTESNSELHGIN